jgi:hypothetical protein
MSYASDINADDYLYIKPVYVVETAGSNHTDVVLKVELTTNNFNFSHARSDGYDFRMAERSNGQLVLHSWITSWTTASATVRFRLPSLLAGETKQLFAYWGNSSASSVSDVSSVGFILGDTFDTFDSSVWAESTPSCATVSNSELEISYGQSIYAKAANIFGLNRDWIIECKFRTPSSPVVTWGYTIGITTDGTGSVNAPGIYLFYAPDEESGNQYHRNHNFWTCSYAVDPGPKYESNYDKGISLNSNHLIRITYNESTDILTYYMNKDVAHYYGYKEYTDTAERVCQGNTRPTGIRLTGRQAVQMCQSYIDYIVIEALQDDLYSIDLSNLYVELENVPYEYSGLSYGPDLTSTYYNHETTLGGNPYRLSVDDLLVVFETTSISGEVVIDFSKKQADLTSNNRIHYDNGHVSGYAAVKLSDKDTDKYGEYWFESTTQSGYAAITLSGTIESLAVKGFGDSSTPKDFRFVGTDDDPRFSPTTTLLASGTFNQSSGWQTKYFDNSTSFDYHSLYFDSTYGSNAKIQEWRMYEGTTGSGVFTAARLKLRPGTLSTNYRYFPKNIAFYGNIDLDNWVELIPATKTYTPSISNWQEYAFTNAVGYRAYKLLCWGNWNNTTDKIIISEWELNEIV